MRKRTGDTEKPNELPSFGDYRRSRVPEPIQKQAERDLERQRRAVNAAPHEKPLSSTFDTKADNYDPE